MEPITELEIFRDTELIYTVPIDEKTEHVENFMSDDGVAFDVTGGFLPWSIDDYMMYAGEKYTLFELPRKVQLNADRHRYSGRFESPLYDLRRDFIMHLGDLTFSFTGTAEDHLDLLLSCVHETIDVAWQKGEVEVTEFKTIEYDATYLRDALNMIAKEFGLEFKAKFKTIDLKKHVGTIVPLTIAYGRGKGLYELTQTAVDRSGILTRVRCFGGSKNIDHTYRNGAKKLVFEERFLDIVSPYKYRADVYENPDRYPKRIAHVAAVTELDEATQLFTISDPTLDFDINAHLLEGIPGKVSFQTGELTGSDFDIHKYDPVTKVITLKALTDQGLPNSTFKPAPGNKYGLIDIKMPQSYITNEENLLRAEGLEFLNKNSLPKFIYDLNAIDERFIRKSGVTLTAADEITLQHEAEGLDHLLRITGLRRPLPKPYAIKAVISNFLYYTVTEKLKEQVESNVKEIKVVNKTNAEKARINTRELNTLMSRVFDPDGNLAEGMTSIWAAMAKFGIDSQNFGLTGTKIVSNADGDPNKFTISSGTLIHYIYKIESLGYNWVMSGAEFTGLDPAKFYYVYAKCSQSSLTGVWEISETPIKVDAFAGYWCFNLGQLFEVNEEGYRSTKFTKGVTFIVGNEITTGIVKSVSGQTFLNLDDDTFNFGDQFSGIDWGVTTPGKLTLRGALAQNASGVSAPLAVYRGQYMAGVTYYQGDSVFQGGATYRMTYITPITGIAPPNTTYWQVEAAQGVSAKRQIYRLHNSATVAPSIDNVPNPSIWSSTPPTPSPPATYLWMAIEITSTGGAWMGWNTPVCLSGIPGDTPQFTEIRFAKNGSPSAPPALDIYEVDPFGWSIVEPEVGPLEYLWRTSALKKGSALLSSWSTPVRFNARDGAAGAQGPYPLGRGDWKAGVSYYGGTNRVEIVKYSGVWYVTRTDAGTIAAGTLPTNAAKWNPFGGQFESVATDLLFANLAYIDNLGVKWARTSEGVSRVELRGDRNSLEFYEDNQCVINLSSLSAVDNGAIYTSTIPVYDVFGKPTWIYIKVVGGTTIYYYQPRDIGMSFGLSPSDVLGYTSIGRKKIQTTGEVISSNPDGTQVMIMGNGYMSVYDASSTSMLDGYTGGFYDRDGNYFKVIGGIICLG